MDKDYGLSCVYPYFIHPNTIWALQDGLMYVSLYEEYPSYKEWDYYYFRENLEQMDFSLEAIGIIDIRTGEADRESMRIPGEAGQKVSMFPLDRMSLGEGVVYLYKTGFQGRSIEYEIPMVNTGEGGLTAGSM